MLRVNCEQNSLLYLVRPLGAGACHTKDADGKARSGCYYRRIERHCIDSTRSEARKRPVLATLVRMTQRQELFPVISARPDAVDGI